VIPDYFASRNRASEVNVVTLFSPETLADADMRMQSAVPSDKGGPRAER